MTGNKGKLVYNSLYPPGVFTPFSITSLLKRYAYKSDLKPTFPGLYAGWPMWFAG
jgi:hypothetical protein